MRLPGINNDPAVTESMSLASDVTVTARENFGESSYPYRSASMPNVVRCVAASLSELI